jgi:predicted helicase
MDLQKKLHEIFLKGGNSFDNFIVECQKWYSEPAHTLTEMRTRDNKKIRGDIFEEFCVLYLTQLGYKAWRLEDVPEEILVNLGMKRKDMGIDIVVERESRYSAVQCKYKTPTGKKSYVTWKALSTFYALCMRTGPWDSYIVMTNCDFVRHVGEKTAKDISMCLKTFQGIPSSQWVSMCGIVGNVQEPLKTPSSIEELRQARIAYYSRTAAQASPSPFLS